MPRPLKPWYWKQRDCWCVDVAGKRQILARGKDAKAEATAEFHRLMVAEGKREQNPHKITAATVFDLFLDSVDRAVQRGERAKVTYGRYVDFLSSASERFGSARAADVRPHMVTTWAEDRRLGWGATTRCNAVTAVKAAFRWAKREGHIAEDPIRDMPKPTPQRRRAVMTPEQIDRVTEAGDPAWRDLMTALRLTGCRPAEVTTLTADRVDLERGVWLVTNKTRTKTGEELRPVLLVPAMVGLSRRLVEEHPEGPIFRNARGRPWTRNAMACRFRSLRKTLGLGAEATAYAIRHRYAMEGLRRGLDSSELAALMGHTNPKMVDQVYGHWDQQLDRLRDAARRVHPGESGAG